MLSTGLNSLDQVIQGVLPGDNIVWQVDSIDDYAIFVEPFCTDAVRQGKKLVYFRFARHVPAGRRRHGGRDPSPVSGAGLRDLHRRDPQRDRTQGARRLLRVRLPLRPRRRLVQRPDAGQLLHGHLPVPVRPGDGHLLRAAPGSSFHRGGRGHSRHDADPARRVPAQRQALRASAQGLPAPLADHVPAPRLRQRRVPPIDGERGPVRDAGADHATAARLRFPHARRLGPHFHAGTGSPGRHPERRAPGERAARRSSSTCCG